MSKGYRELTVWKKAIELVKKVYGLLEGFPKEERYGLVGQLKRSSVSVPSNIAEGQARRTPGEFKRFLNIALGSLAEVDTQLVLAKELGLISTNELNAVELSITDLRKMISGLLRKLNTDN